MKLYTVAYTSIHHSGEYSPKAQGRRRRIFNIEYMEQRHRIARFARRHGLEVRYTLCEVMELAPDDFFARQGIEQLIGFMPSVPRSHQPVSPHLTVLVESRNRFHAPDLELALMLLHFSRKGVRLFEVSSGRELTAEAAALESTIAQADPSDVRAAENRLRTAKWRDTKKRNGRKCGPKPFGELPEEAAVVEEICRLRLKPRNRPRKSYQQIAAILNKLGMPTRSNKPWQAKTVQTIIWRRRPWLHNRSESSPYWRLDVSRNDS